jgi:hypothetical protein
MHKSSPTTEEMSDEKASMLLFKCFKEMKEASNLLLSTIDKLKKANNAIYGNNFQKLSKYDRL